jgi:hypothetical protein
MPERLFPRGVLLPFLAAHLRYYGPYAVTEGVVKNYSWKKTSNSVFERFEVNGIRFGYLDMPHPKCFQT